MEHVRSRKMKKKKENRTGCGFCRRVRKKKQTMKANEGEEERKVEGEEERSACTKLLYISTPYQIYDYMVPLGKIFSKVIVVAHEVEARSDADVMNRSCIELKNLPHKASAMDLEDYIRGAKARYVKCTRTYCESGGNRSDRWVVEYDNQKDADTVFNYSHDIYGHNVRARFISSREVDDLYAIPAPDGRGGSYNQRRQNYQHQSTVSEPKPLFPEFQHRDSVGWRPWL